MHAFETTPKQWGNSLGITIPKDVVDKEQLSPGKRVRVLVITDKRSELRKVFGSLKLKMPTQKAMEEIDREYYD